MAWWYVFFRIKPDDSNVSLLFETLTKHGREEPNYAQSLIPE